MKDVKEYLNLFKELWKNKRYRSLIILGFYFIFIMFIVMGLKSTPSIPKVEEPVKTSYESMNNYEYTYTITSNEVINIEGMRYQDKEIILYKNDNKKYYYDEDGFYLVSDNQMNRTSYILYDYSMKDLRPNRINQLLLSSTLSHEMSYQNNEIKKEYKIAIKDYLRWLNGTFSSDDSIITIEVIEKDSLVNKITLDLTNYNNTTLTINYFNHNKLTNIEVY